MNSWYKLLKTKLLNIKKRRQWFLFLLLNLFSLILIFPCFSFYSSTQLEMNASNIADTTKTKTKSGEYLEFVVESLDQQKYPMISPSVEFRSIYGAFRESKVTFIGAANSDKEKNIHIKEIETDNLSMLYSNVNSNVEYKNHYKHEFYPLELMFQGKHSMSGVFSFCYLSKTQASKLLASRGLETNENNFESLLSTKITMTIDGTDYLYSIGNIYLETNYFFEGLTETMGEFVLCYSNLPSELNKQACYFMREYTFQNLFFIKRINSLYNKESFSLKINHYNLTDSIDDANLLYFYHDYKTNTILDALSIIVAIITLVLFLSSLYLLFIFELANNFQKTLFLFLIGFIPYLLFKILFFFTRSLLCFTYLSTTFYLIMMLLYFTALCISFVYTRRKHNL